MEYFNQLSEFDGVGEDLSYGFTNVGQRTSANVFLQTLSNLPSQDRQEIEIMVKYLKCKSAVKSSKVRKLINGLHRAELSRKLT